MDELKRFWMGRDELSNTLLRQVRTISAMERRHI
jgi:hypothetical protein